MASASEVAAALEKVRTVIAKLQKEISDVKADMQAADPATRQSMMLGLYASLRKELATLRGREELLLKQQSGGDSTSHEVAALKENVAGLTQHVAELHLQRLAASKTTRGYHDIGKEARLGLQPGLERNGLAVLNDGKVLQECVTKVLEELGISTLVTPPGASFEETVKAAAGADKPAKRRHTESALSPELSEGVPSTTGMGNEEVTGNEAVMGSEKVAADTPGSSAQCPPGWSLFDLVCRAHPTVAVTKLREDTHMQPEAFKLLAALAKALGFPGGLKDTHRSAGLLVDPVAKPDSMAVTPGWTVPTWSAAVVLFEFKLHTTQSELDIMLGQLVQGCMAALHHQPNRSFVYAVGLTMDNIQVFRFQRPTLSGAHLLSISSTGLQPFSLHPESAGFRSLAGLLKMDLRELGVVAAELPQQVLWDQDDYSLDDFRLQLLQTGSRQRCGNSVYLLLRKLPGGGNARPSGATPEAVLKLSSAYVPFEAETLVRLQLQGPIANVVQLVASGTCNLEGRPMKAMVVKPFAHRLEQGHPALMFAAVARDVAQAIGELDKRGFLHRDVTPNNFGYVLDGNQCRGLLFDFSAATTVVEQAWNKDEIFLDSTNSTTFPTRITGTLAWAPYSVLLGREHTLSSQLEGLFISLHSVAMGSVGRPGHRQREASAEAWACERLAQFTAPALPFSNRMPEPLRPLITALHGLFWPLPEGGTVRTHRSDVTVSDFVSAVEST